MSNQPNEEMAETEAAEEPMTINELFSHAIQDLLAGESPETLTDEFFDEFVSQGREETSQMLMLLDMPNETVIEMLIQTQLQAVEVLKQNAPGFLDALRNSVKLRLAGMA